MQQSSTTSDEIISPQVSLPSVRSQKEQPSAKTSQYGCSDKAYRDENIFSTFASVKMKLVHASNNYHDEEENDAAVSDTTGHRVTPNRGQISTGDTWAAVDSKRSSDASGNTFGVDPTAASQTPDNESAVYNEVDDVVSLPEAATSDEQGVAVDTRQTDIPPSEAEVSLNNTCVTRNRNPEFYSPTRKLDFTKKLSNKALSDPLPGDEEETVIVKKKQNPLKRLFGRKKGKFDPVSADVFQSELPCTDQEMSSQTKKHKFKMKIGKKKSREVLDLNSPSGVGSNLEIDQIQGTLATKNTHNPHSVMNIDTSSDPNRTKHGEVSSKGKCKTRGKITKENIIVMKSTGKLLSDFGNASVDSLSAPPVIDRENIAKETAQENGNGESNGNPGQSDNNQQQHSIDDNNDEHNSTDDSDDLQHLDDMLDHIYANFASVDPAFSVRNQSHDDLHVSGGDESTGIDVTAQVGEIIDDKSSSGEMNMVYFDEKAQAEEIDRGDISDKEKAASGNGDTRGVGMGSYNDKVQEGDLVMRDVSDKVQIRVKYIENINDKTQEGNIHRENTDYIVGESAICTENVYDTVQGAEKGGKYMGGKSSGEAIGVDNSVDKLQEDMETVESVHDQLQDTEISVEYTDEKLQGREIGAENVDNKLQDQKLGIDNTYKLYDQCGTVVANNRTSDKDGENPTMTKESKQHALGYNDITEASIESAIISNEMDVNQSNNKAESDSAMKRLLDSSVVDGLEKEVNSLPGDNGLTEFSVCGDIPRDVRVGSLGRASSTPASNKLMLDVNIPDNMKDDPTYNCVEETSTGDDVLKSNIHTHFSALFAPVDAIECQGAIAPDVIADDLTNLRAITQDNVLQDTSMETHDLIPDVDVCPCLTSQPPAQTQTGVSSPHNEPEDVSSDLDTDDIARLETTFDIPETESSKNTNMERVFRHDKDGVDVSNVFIERVEEKNIEFYREMVTCTPPGDGIVWDNSQISVKGSRTAQSEIKQTRHDQNFNDLLLFPNKDLVNLPGWQTQTVQDRLLPAAEQIDQSHPVGELHDQLRTTEKLQADKIPHNLRKPTIKPKPHVVQSLLYTAQETTTNAQAKSGRNPLHSYRGADDLVDVSAITVQPRAVTLTSVEYVKEDLVRNWSQDFGKEDINEHRPDIDDGSSSDKMSRGILKVHSGYVQEHHAGAESQVTDQVNENLSDDVSDVININDHVIDEVHTNCHASAHVRDEVNSNGHATYNASVTDEVKVDIDKLEGDPETELGVNFLVKSGDQTLDSRGSAGHKVHRSSSSTSVGVMNLDSHLPETYAGLSTNDALHTTVSTRLLVDLGQTCEDKLQQRPDINDGRVVDKREDEKSGNNINSGIDVEKEAGNSMWMTESKDSFDETETCVQDQGSTIYTRDVSTRDTSQPDTSTRNSDLPGTITSDISRSSSSIRDTSRRDVSKRDVATLDTSIRDISRRDTESSKYYEYAGDKLTSDDKKVASGHAINANAEAIGDKTFRSEASDYPNKNADTLSSTYELDSFQSVYHRELDRDNIYDEISEEIYVKDVSCLTSKRFQFPWKKKEKKSEKKGEINDRSSIVAKEKVKVKPTKWKPAIKPKPVLKVSECSKSGPHVQDDKTAITKRRSGKGKRKSASFTLPSEESLYNEIDEDLWRRHDAMEDLTSSSSSTSDDDLSYEPINYSEKDGGKKKGEASSLPQEAMEYRKSLLNSADSLGYEIPAKFSLKAMGRARNNGAADTSSVEYPAEQDSPSLNPGAKEADNDSELGFEADSCSCEDLPVFGQVVNLDSGQLESSSLPTDVDTSERSDSQTWLPVGVCAVNSPSSHEMVSEEDKSWTGTFDSEKAGTCQTFARNQVSSFSIGNIPTTVVSHGEITENRDSASSPITEGLTLGGGIRVPSVTPTAECSNALHASPHYPSTCEDKEQFRGRRGSSNSSDKEKERSLMEDEITRNNTQIEDGSRGGYDTSRLSENVTGDNLNRLKTRIDEQTSRPGGVALSEDSKETRDRSTNVRLGIKVNLDTHTPQTQQVVRDVESHTPQRQQPVRDVDTHTPQRQQLVRDVDTHTPQRQQLVRDVDTHTLQRQQSTPDVDKKVNMKVGKNREMLAGYNQVMKSLAALFVSNNDSENLHTKIDHTSSLETKCSETQANDLPKKACMDNQRGPQSSTDISIELHKVEAVSTHLQITNCVSEREVELLPSKQRSSGMLFHGRQENSFQDETQERQKVLLSAARTQSNVHGWSRRKCFSLKDIPKICDGNSATVTRSFDSRIYAEINSPDIRLEILRRISSLPKAFKPHTFKITHCGLESGSLSVASTSQSIRTHSVSLHRQQDYMTESEELVMRKAGEQLLETARSSPSVNSKDTRSISNSQAGTMKHKAIPPIPHPVATTTRRGKTHLTVPVDDEGDEKPEYDLPPIRAKRISQSRILSWPGLPVSGTTQHPTANTPALKPAERPMTAGSNRSEYAAPWEGTGLESLGSTPPPHNTQFLTEDVQEAVSSQTADLDQLVKDKCLISRSTGSLENRFVVTLGARGKPVHVGHDDLEATKMFGKKHRRLPSEGDEEDTPAKKSSFLRLMASLFHRKKKTFNVHDDHPEGDEMSSNASEEDSATFDFISSPLEVTSEIITSFHRDSAASADTKNTLPPGDTGENSVTAVTNVRPLCRLLKLNEDGTRTIEFIQPWLHYQGVTFTKDSHQSRGEGVFVAPFVDKGISKLLAGFLDVGDQVLEIDGLDVSTMSVDEINILVQTKQQMTVTISPSNTDD